MPDLPTRTENESKLAAAVSRVHLDAYRRLPGLLGSPASLENVPQSEWERHQNELATILFLLLGHTYRQAYGLMQLRFGWQPADGSDKDSPGRLPQLDWASRQSKKTADSVVKSTRAMLGNLISRINKEDDPPRKKQALAQGLTVIFGPRRSTVISATETTRAITAGEKGFSGDFTRATGKRIVAVWKAEDDCCPICASVEGEPEAVWARRFPDGPPSPHPECRCWLEWQLA